MNLPQWIAGGAALICLAAALNILVWTQDPFAFSVLAPLTGAFGCGLVWLVFTLTGLAGQVEREGRAVGGLQAAASSLVFLGICITLYAFAQRWDVSWDLTQEGRRDLAEQTVRVLESMTDEVQVLCFFLAVEDELVKIARDKTMRFLEQCQRHSGLLEVELLDPQRETARLAALGITHASPRGTVVLRSGTRQRVITLSGGSPRLEERDFTNALVNILRGRQPKVYFLTGHGERSILDADETEGASMFANLLMAEGYEVQPLAIRLTHPELPADADLIVLHGPRSDLQAVEIQLLDGYLREGGRLLILLDPPLSAREAFVQRQQLLPWLASSLGIEAGVDIAISDAQDNVFEVHLSHDASPFAAGQDEAFMHFTGAFNSEHPITRGFDQAMLMQGARSVGRASKLPGRVTVEELLRTTPDFWAETDLAMLAEQGRAAKSLDEREGPLPIAAAATLLTEHELDDTGRYREARVVVTGNASFAGNAYMNVPGNFNFTLNSVAWLTEAEELIAIRPRGIEAPPLILTSADERAIAWFSTLFTVQAVLAAGLVVGALRRRNQ